MASSNYIFKVAIVGAGGNLGSFITRALLETGKHSVTAITRTDSESQLPDGVASKKVDYNEPETIVEALRDQDALIITLSGHTPQGAERLLVEAAGKAGVKWILPNEWSPDTANEALVRDVFVFQPKVATRKAIADLGQSSYVAVSTGFWYEWSLAIPAAFGLDIANRTATLFDEGETKISLSTWPQIGRAVAALLSLPIAFESGGVSCLEDFKNKVVYMDSFTVSQKDMLESILRVTGDTADAWTVCKEPAQERYASGISDIKDGKRVGFAKMMYTRVFYPDGCGDVENGKGTINNVLGLSKEDIDEATKVAVERSRSSPSRVD